MLLLHCLKFRREEKMHLPASEAHILIRIYNFTSREFRTKDCKYVGQWISFLCEGNQNSDYCQTLVNKYFTIPD